MSKASLDALRLGDRDLVRDVARRSVQVMRKEWDERETEARETVIADGVHVNTVDKDAFAAATRPVLDKYISEPRLRALYEQIAATA